MEDALKLAELYEVEVQELICTAPSVGAQQETIKKTGNNGQISVLVDLDGSINSLESSILRLKKINELIARQEL